VSLDIDNDKIAYEKMLESHQKKTSERSKKATIVLAVQDSTTLFLRGTKKVPNIRKVGTLKNEFTGLNIHTTLLVTPEEEILGISDLQEFERKLVGKRNRAYENLSALYKETGKWIRAIRNTRKVIDKETQLVWIADREGDFWDYFCQIQEYNELFVQRVVHQRGMHECEDNYFEHVKSQPCMGKYSFEIDSQGGGKARKSRIVNCEVRSAKVTLKKPDRLKRDMNTFSVLVIHVLEVGTKEPLEWFLITNIACDTFEEILEKIKWYRMRWKIEELHRTVKSGCGIEEMRLESLEKLMKLALLLFIVGMRILKISKLAKKDENSECTTAFSKEEWQMLYIRKHKKFPPENYVPTIKEALRLLAGLGGFYEYNKRDPGAMTMWRGMHRLSLMLAGIEMYEAAMKIGT
jgi:hypothetical protein